MTIDSGPLIAFERQERRIEAWLQVATDRNLLLTVPAVVVAEVWRGGAKSARIARALSFCDLISTTEEIAKHAGILLSATGTSNTIDAIVVATASLRRENVLTADYEDLSVFAEKAGTMLLRY